jgi:tRNA U34 5-methylaminomethyl-2-thiouridine-forming methyltransferase MnmC
LTAWAKGERRFEIGSITAEILVGDARETLPQWQGRADAWFLDGFSLAKNPELWSPDLMAEVARHTAPQGTFATYTAAGHVRRALAEAGFTVDRRPGHGRKRHMSVGVLA